MVRWLRILFGTLRSCLRTQRELALENLALRQQLAVWKARGPRPRLTDTDRMFWALLSRLWTSWRHSLQVVRPETVVGWHRQGFRTIRSAHGQCRSPRSDSAHELRQSSLGCAKHPRRVAEARFNGVASDGVEVHAPTSTAAVAGVARVFEQSREGLNRLRFLHGTHRDLSGPVRAVDPDPQPAPAGAFQCHRPSDGGMDGTPTARGMRVGG